jgi:phosphoribosyl-ATP pyrophosphohydrolase/phosphoribosyl-AMP cyclohydrolase
LVVKPQSNACHTGNYSCFTKIRGKEEQRFTLSDLYNKIKSRIDENNPESYTKKLIEDLFLSKRKLVEEAAEVITAKDRDNLIWECSDLIYFLFVTMAKEGITLEDIEKENQRRNGK